METSSKRLSRRARKLISHTQKSTFFRHIFNYIGLLKHLTERRFDKAIIKDKAWKLRILRLMSRSSFYWGFKCFQFS